MSGLPAGNWAPAHIRLDAGGQLCVTKTLQGYKGGTPLVNLFILNALKLIDAARAACVPFYTYVSHAESLSSSAVQSEFCAS